jgi:hypothetical protein
MRSCSRVAISKAGAIDHRHQYFLGQHGLAKPAWVHSAERHQVKVRVCKKFTRRRRRSNTPAKRKSPAVAGPFDKFHFRSAHFASLAI